MDNNSLKTLIEAILEQAQDISIEHPRRGAYSLRWVIKTSLDLTLKYLPEWKSDEQENH